MISSIIHTGKNVLFTGIFPECEEQKERIHEWIGGETKSLELLEKRMELEKKVQRFYTFIGLYFSQFLAHLAFLPSLGIHRIHVIELLCYNWSFANFWLEIWFHNWRFFIDVFDACFYCLLMFSFCLFQY